MHNVVNPKNYIHPDTITLLTSGTFDTYHILTAGGKGREQIENALQAQRAKKVVSDSPGLVDFAIGLVNSVFNLPDGQVMFYEEFE